MRFHYLGHASWLLEASGLRLALDPILFDKHACGVFEVVPKRRIDAAALRADFVFVSHAHFDHFDIDSLAALARFDPETVLVTSDELVRETAETLGFRTVQLVAPGVRVELADGLSLVTTPSFAPDVEWGELFADASGTAWNMIDTVFPTSDDVRRVYETASGGRALDLALAPIQTLREIALATAEHVGFRAGDHAHLLACAAATGAKTIAPSACGEALAAPYSELNHWVYPVSRERAARDLEAFSPGTKTLVPRLGEVVVVEGGSVCLDAPQLPIEIVGEPRDPRAFRPLEPAPVFDPNLEGRDPGSIRAAIVSWARAELAPALRRELGGRERFRGVVCVLEAVFSDGDRLSLRFDTEGRVEERGDVEYDVLVIVAASMLLDVVEGRRCWTEPLLAGLLRSSVRGARVTPGSCTPLNIAPMFPYYAIPYRASIERSVRARARAAKARSRV